MAEPDPNRERTVLVGDAVWRVWTYPHAPDQVEIQGPRTHRKEGLDATLTAEDLCVEVAPGEKQEAWGYGGDVASARYIPTLVLRVAFAMLDEAEGASATRV